ncbi:MAG: hypothetical protein ACYSWU_25250, partial [Planctomycetota bacterium]
MTPIFHLPPAALRLSLPVVALSGLLAGAAPAADEVAITPQEAWSGVFGGQDVTFNYTIDAPEDFRGRLGWSLSVDGRTLSRGETALAAQAGGPRPAAVRLRIPETRAGVVIRARLSLEVYDGGRGNRLASQDRTLWVFSSDPFALRFNWLKALKITLFDPQGDTQKILEQAKVPFRQIHNVAALPQMTGGLLVIGQGTSLEEYRSLPEILVRLAARGVPVVCLAPSAGKFPMPGAQTAEAGLPAPKRVVLRRQDAITALDKRLDAVGWPPDGKIVAGTVSITADRSR